MRAVGGSFLKRQDRLAILRNTLDELAKINYISITNVIVDKAHKTTPSDVFDGPCSNGLRTR